MASHQLEDRNHRTHQKCWYYPTDDRRLASLALRFTLSQPVTAAIPPGDPDLFRLAVDLAQEFTPITGAETDELRSLAHGKAPIFELAHA
jgi:hypothetical protein